MITPNEHSKLIALFGDNFVVGVKHQAWSGHDHTDIVLSCQPTDGECRKLDALFPGAEGHMPAWSCAVLTFGRSGARLRWMDQCAVDTPPLLRAVALVLDVSSYWLQLHAVREEAARAAGAAFVAKHRRPRSEQ